MSGFPVLPVPESVQEQIAKNNNREFALYAFKYCAKACNLWEATGDSLRDEQQECLSRLR